MREKSGIVIAVLAVMVVVLLGLVLWAFVFNPMINGYATKIYNQGANDAVKAVVGQVQQKGYVQLPVNENQSVMLVPYNPNQTQQTVNNS